MDKVRVKKKRSCISCRDRIRLVASSSNLLPTPNGKKSTLIRILLLPLLLLVSLTIVFFFSLLHLPFTHFCFSLSLLEKKAEMIVIITTMMFIRGLLELFIWWGERLKCAVYRIDRLEVTSVSSPPFRIWGCWSWWSSSYARVSASCFVILTSLFPQLFFLTWVSSMRLIFVSCVVRWC